LGEGVTYQDAYAIGLGVCEVEPAGKAALEIREVYKYVSQLLDLPTMRNDHEKNSRPRKRVA
jgi:chromosome partitioning protein